MSLGGEPLTSDAMLADEFVFAPPSFALPRRRVVAGALVALLGVVGLGGLFVLRSRTVVESASDTPTEVLGTTTQAKTAGLQYTFVLGDGAGARSVRFVAPSSKTNGADSTLGAIEGTIAATIGFEVIDVQEDGSALVEATVESVGTKQAAAFEAARLRLNVAPEGRVSAVEGVEGIFAGERTSVATEDVAFPQDRMDALEIGQTWSESLTVAIDAATP